MNPAFLIHPLSFNLGCLSILQKSFTGQMMANGG